MFSYVWTSSVGCVRRFLSFLANVAQFLQDVDGSSHNRRIEERPVDNGHAEISGPVSQPSSPRATRRKALIAVCVVTGWRRQWLIACRYLNIRLDGISVEDPERHPHMVSPSSGVRNLGRAEGVDGGEELLHPWLGCAVREDAITECGHDIAGGRYEKRYVLFPIL